MNALIDSRGSRVFTHGLLGSISRLCNYRLGAVALSPRGATLGAKEALTYIAGAFTSYDSAGKLG